MRHSSSSSSSSRTKSLKLPRLPVPPLRQTLDKYLASIEPFLLSDEAKGGQDYASAYAQRVKWADEFEAGIGQRCQDRLKALDKASPRNWLDDNFWLKKAYLEWRAPLLVNSNWWLAFLDDEALRRKVVNANDITPQQLRRAAWLIHRTLEFRSKMDSQELHPDTTRTGLWLRECVLKMFNIARIPKPTCDVLSTPNPSSPHFGKMIVMVENWTYAIDVCSSSSRGESSISSVARIEQSLKEIALDAQERHKRGEGALLVGALSADDRDRWSKNLEHLLGLSPKNRRNYDIVTNSVLALSLESNTHHFLSTQCPSQQNRDEQLHTMRSTATNVSNRLFDKTYTLIVDPSTRAGAMGEHSPVDALVPSIVAEYAMAQNVDDAHFIEGEPGCSWERLDWVTDRTIEEEAQLAHQRAGAIIGDSDNSVLWFTEYGTDWITSSAKVSADAYLQMALQLAWYRTRGDFTATYETALTRMFDKGRTETIRTLTRESQAFVLAMNDTSISATAKFAALQEAVRTHTRLTREAATGRGIDRHLLGLRSVLEPQEAQGIKLFEDPIYTRSSTWKLSTSGLSAGHLFTGTGFGTSYHDGYGINYVAAPDKVKFGIESKLSNPDTSTAEFKQAIVWALDSMRGVSEQGQAISNSTPDAVPLHHL